MLAKIMRSSAKGIWETEILPCLGTVSLPALVAFSVEEENVKTINPNLKLRVRDDEEKRFFIHSFIRARSLHYLYKGKRNKTRNELQPHIQAEASIALFSNR
eukprot:TRINITY_DN10891_c0_g1_i1.p2 TRINITY_DN10891_c0_g1~~TRINITY_DN10891_c0_g1_i1.p2  ORF type:complete len:102 (+),score=13.66 TRINITY_DN10891_c0_g1_i1:54-359(+)